EFFSEQGMNFAQGLRILVNQTADAPRLRSGQVLGHHAAVREKNRMLVVHVLSGRTIIVSVESGLAVRMMKPAAFEQSRCAGMIRRGAGPEKAHVLLNALIRHPAVINRSAFARSSQLVENFFRARVIEIFALAEAAGEVADDLPINTRIARGRNRIANAHTTAFARR